MAQGKTAVVQGEWIFPAGDEAGWSEFYTAQLALRELQEVILKGESFFQGNIDARMTAETEVHGFIVQIFHLHFHMQGAAFQIVADGEPEQEGIHGEIFGIAFQGEGYGILSLPGGCELGGRGKTVDGKRICLAMVGIAAFGQTGNIGENVGRPVRPVSRISLPQIFCAADRADAHKLRAGIGDGNVEKRIPDRIQHI